ncbi:phosphoadenosine phosphosulfate reductase family protein [Beijerinckia sp. L45]|uniref:phosphoadenosine phosphosulfate reductase domain-containing protein n=1 Tax=Beijerinckia sp. L45 TaxID=1641855 RepID=UPI00131B6AD4|nr:phosphoadenosine phosphosulfate reductase family protein [Beijerinckia sp. L45]
MSALAQPDLFAGGARMVAEEAVDLTLASLEAYGPRHEHWAIAWSGGKDSTATLTLIVRLIEEGRIAAPKRLSVFYADTRLELPPLQAAADAIIVKLKERDWIDVEIVRAQIDKRFLVYMLGRGVPPPNNSTLRWCTRQIKLDPMAAALEHRLRDLPGTVLMITGVREGESAVRDKRIATRCSKDGGECGQGWYQQMLPEAKGMRGRIATLAPLLHWRVCHVWDWLRIYAPSTAMGGWPTAMIADAYGGDEAEEINARTGCMGCPLASKDMALAAVVAMPAWDHLAPLLGLRTIYRRLREDDSLRLKKTGLDADGSLSKGKNKQRKGPLTLEARLWALEEIVKIQGAVNIAARELGRPGVDMLNEEEISRIGELICRNTWPNGWDGDEPTADTWIESVFPDGSVQGLLIGVSP